ncbi:unnamed protein product [Effrenium voratum]|nr:unnamed protein product [Effrenium voratum]
MRAELMEKLRELMKQRMTMDRDMWNCVKSFLYSMVDSVWEDVEKEIELNVELAWLKSDRATKQNGPVTSWRCYDWLRRKVLRHYLPYDRSIFGKLKNPLYLALTLTMLVPNAGFRVSVLSVILGFILVPGPPDEFQLINFILLSKGTQFITGGLVSMGQGAAIYFGCFNWSEDHLTDCIANRGPGKVSSLTGELADYLGSVLLVWVAFLALPFAQEHRQQKRESTRRNNAAESCESPKRKFGGRLANLLRYDVGCFMLSLLVLFTLTAGNLENRRQGSKEEKSSKKGWGSEKGAKGIKKSNLDRRRPLADLIDYARSCSKALDGLSGQEEQLMSTRALEEMGERLLLVAADQRGSKPLEKLIKKAASEGFLAAFKRLLDDLDNLAPNQYASHVLETALKSWAERLGQEKDPEFFKPIVATCNKVQEEGSWDSLMNSPCSAHVVRGLLMALGGYAPETDKEKAARAGLLPQTKHEVPPEVVECRRQTAASLIKLIRLDSSLCLSSHASPVLQLLLRLLRDCHDRALLAEACAAVVGAKAVTGPPCLERCDALRRSAPGSRVLEAVLETSGAELFGELFARFFRPRLSELAMAEFGPFLVQKLADGLREPPQLQLALGELDFVALLGSGQNAQHAVVLKMLEAALRLRAGLKAAAGNVFRALALQNASEHPKAWPTLLALQSLEVDDLLEKDSKEKDSKQKESKSKERKASDAEGRLRRLPAAGPTILAVLLRFPADTVAPITAGLSKMLRPQLLLAMAQEAKTARVLEAALAPSSALENRRLKLAAAFKGLLGQLGPHHVGGWVCAALWRAARSQESLREAFAQELLAVEAELRQRNFAVWKVCGLNQVKLRSEEWVQQQKKAGKVQALFGPLLGDEEAAKALEAQRARAAEDEAQRQVALDPTVAALLPYEPESPTGEAEAPAPAQNPKATQDESLQQTLQLIKTKAGVKRKRKRKAAAQAHEAEED